VSVRRSLGWALISQSTSFIVGFISSVVVTRILSPREIGVYAIASAFVGVLAIISAFNVQSYIVRARTLDMDMLESAFTVNMVVSIVMSVAIFLLSFGDGILYNEKDIGRVLSILCVSPLLGIIEIIPSSIIIRDLNFRVVSIISTARVTVGAVAVVILAYKGYGSVSPAAGAVIAGSFSAIAYATMAPNSMIFKLRFVGVVPILKFGFHMIAIGGVASLASRLSDIIIGKALGLPALGLYSRASGIADLVFTNVYGSVTRVMFVNLAKELRERGVIHDTFLSAIAMITAVMWPTCIGLAVLSKPIIYNLYGEKWIESAIPLSLLMIAQTIVLAFGMNWELFVLRNETSRQVRYELVRAFVGVVAFSIGSIFSISAASIGRIAEASFGYFLYRPHMDKLAGTKAGELEKVYCESAFLTLVAVLPSFILMCYSGWSHLIPAASIGVSVTVGVLCWMLLMFVRSHPLLEELLFIIRGIFARAHS
jgi:O-antigen/teichoic acid export membrane protein